MAYEFEEPDAELTGAIPMVPAFWEAQSRIYQLLPSEMTFISWNSVILDKDKEKRQIGIDSNDYLPHPDNVRFSNTDQSIGIVRLLLDHPVEAEGFIIDLRYASRFLRRALDFQTPEFVDEDDDTKTVPPLGALFVNPENEKLWLSSEHEKALRPFALDLARFVDEERKRRGGAVLGEVPERLATETTKVEP